jgi:hypothetical protein
VRPPSAGESDEEYAQRLRMTFPLLDRVLAFGLGWSFVEAAGQKRFCDRFYRQRPFIATLIVAVISVIMAIAGMITLDKDHRKVDWTPLGLLPWLVGPPIAVLLTFLFRSLVHLFPILRTYHMQGLGDRQAVHARLLGLSLVVPVLGVVGTVVDVVLVFIARDMGSWPPVVLAGNIFGTVALIVFCAMAIPLAYCLFVLELLLHFQQVHTLHQLIMECSPDILTELNNATPLHERQLLHEAPEKLRGLRPLRAASTNAVPGTPRTARTGSASASGVRIATNPLAASLPDDGVPSSPRPPPRSTAVTDPPHAALDLPSNSPPQAQCLCNNPGDVAVDDVILLHNAVQGSINSTAKVWLGPIVLIFFVVVVETAFAAVNMINGTTGTSTPVFAFWLFVGPAILLLFLCPIVTFNSLWPKLMGSTMDWSRWCTNDRIYLLSQLSASNNALNFSLCGFAMTWPALIKLILPIAAPALISQLLRFKDVIIHPPT